MIFHISPQPSHLPLSSSHYSSASSPPYFLFVCFLLSLDDPWGESRFSVSLHPPVQSQTQLPLRAQQLGWGHSGRGRCGAAQTWRRKGAGPRRPWWDCCGHVRLLAVWTFLHLLPILSGSVHWRLPLLQSTLGTHSTQPPHHAPIGRHHRHELQKPGKSDTSEWQPVLW